MLSNDMLSNKITIMVNSCDSYEDLWIPFFTLFRKYWEDKNVRVMLNTESKVFSMDGLQIDCISAGDNKNYGARMLNALSKVKTEYVMILLDDFFLRKPVDMSRIHQIIGWMDADKDITYFNSDCTAVYAEWEVDKYPGFCRIPPGSDYVLNLQAAIWRTSVLKKYWRPNVSPWEWEEYSSLLTIFNKKHKFYCAKNWEYTICDYGYVAEGMGVFRGKWVEQDVKPLFEKEHISVDFSCRGFYNPEKDTGRIVIASRKDWYDLLLRCFGIMGLVTFFVYRIYSLFMKVFKKETPSDGVVLLRELARKRFLKNMW